MGTADFFNGLQFWISFALSLMVFSLLFGENLLSRLAHYLLAGASLGYLAILLLQNILKQRLIMPLMRDPLGDWAQLGLLFFSLLLFVSGFFNLLRPPTARRSIENQSEANGQNDGSVDASFADNMRMTPQNGGQTAPQAGCSLGAIGMIPVALIIGVALATAATGAIQGTLLPQFIRAAQIGFAWEASPGVLLNSVFLLLITTGVLLHLYVNTTTEETTIPANEQEQAKTKIPQTGDFFTLLVTAWRWLGKRALWFAAGMLFARLVASRLSLLAAQVEFWISGLLGALP